MDEQIKAIVAQLEADTIDPEVAMGSIKNLVTDHGKEMKKYGALSMAKLVKKMREQQKRYFTHKSKEALRESKKLEAQVDSAVETILKVQG